MSETKADKRFIANFSSLFPVWTRYLRCFLVTGKSLSEALLFAEHGENMVCTKIVLNVRNNFCTQHVLPRFELGIFMYWTCNSMNNLWSYCGLVDAKIRASDKDLPVLNLEEGHVLLSSIIRQVLHLIFVYRCDLLQGYSCYIFANVAKMFHYVLWQAWHICKSDKRKLIAHISIIIGQRT